MEEISDMGAVLFLLDCKYSCKKAIDLIGFLEY